VDGFLSWEKLQAAAKETATMLVKRCLGDTLVERVDLVDLVDLAAYLDTPSSTRPSSAGSTRPTLSLNPSGAAYGSYGSSSNGRSHRGPYSNALVHDRPPVIASTRTTQTRESSYIPVLGGAPTPEIAGLGGTGGVGQEVYSLHHHGGNSSNISQGPIGIEELRTYVPPEHALFLPLPVSSCRGARWWGVTRSHTAVPTAR
jgi:hypothetical protein